MLRGHTYRESPSLLSCMPSRCLTIRCIFQKNSPPAAGSFFKMFLQLWQAAQRIASISPLLLTFKSYLRFTSKVYFLAGFLCHCFLFFRPLLCSMSPWAGVTLSSPLPPSSPACLSDPCTSLAVFCIGSLPPQSKVSDVSVSFSESKLPPSSCRAMEN